MEKRGVKKGMTRGNYNTSKIPKKYKQIRLELSTVEQLEKLNGITMNDKINNLLKNVDNF